MTTSSLSHAAPPAAPRARAPRHPKLGLLAWLALVAGTATVGSGPSNSGLYQQLTLPSWAPPSWAFPVAWTVLYVAMAVAAWLVWRERGWGGARVALALFLAQLALNAAWTWIFFGARNYGLALAELAALWLAVLATLLAFWRVRRDAGALLVPYLAWVTFAGALNWAIWRMN